MEQRRKDVASRSGGKIPIFTIKEGTTRMRTLPVGDEQDFAVEGSYIFINKDLGGFISPTTWGEKCAWSSHVEKLLSSKDPDDKKLAERMKAKRRFFSPHIKYSDDKGKEVDTASGAKLLILTNGQYQAMIDLYLEDEYGDMTDPIEGYDLKFKRTGTGKMDTEYSVIPCKSSKLPKEFRKVYDVEAMMRELTPSFEETKEKLSQFLKTEVGVSDDDGDGERPAKKDKKKKKKKKASE